MAHRTGKEASLVAWKEGWTRVRLLLRNPDFRKELSEARKHYMTFFDTAPEVAAGKNPVGNKGEKYTYKKYEAFLKRWNLPLLPHEFAVPTASLDSIQAEEALLWKHMVDSQSHPDPECRYIFRPAVLASDPDEEKLQQFLEDEDNVDALAEGQTISPPRDLQPGNSLVLTLDLGYPKDVLEEMVSIELTRAMKKRHYLEDKGKFPHTPRRRRLDKINIQLAVFDLASEGKKFNEISQTWKIPIPTIKSKYLKACHLIYGLNNGPTKKKVPLEIFDIDSHLKNCTICKKAETTDDMCGKAKAYIDQD